MSQIPLLGLPGGDLQTLSLPDALDALVVDEPASAFSDAPIRGVLARDPAQRFAPQALLCTDLAREPTQFVSRFMRRWSVEVAFPEVRAHLGVETGAGGRTP